MKDIQVFTIASLCNQVLARGMYYVVKCSCVDLSKLNKEVVMREHISYLIVVLTIALFASILIVADMLQKAHIQSIVNTSQGESHD